MTSNERVSWLFDALLPYRNTFLSDLSYRNSTRVISDGTGLNCSVGVTSHKVWATGIAGVVPVAPKHVFVPPALLNVPLQVRKPPASSNSSPRNRKLHWSVKSWIR